MINVIGMIFICLGSLCSMFCLAIAIYFYVKNRKHLSKSEKAAQKKQKAKNDLNKRILELNKELAELNNNNSK